MFEAVIRGTIGIACAPQQLVLKRADPCHKAAGLPDERCPSSLVVRRGSNLAYQCLTGFFTANGFGNQPDLRIIFGHARGNTHRNDLDARLAKRRIRSAAR